MFNPRYYFLTIYIYFSLTNGRNVLKLTTVCQFKIDVSRETENNSEYSQALNNTSNQKYNVSHETFFL